MAYTERKGGLLIFVAFEGIGKFKISIFNISESEISKNRD